MKKAITPLTALPPTGMGAVDKAWDAVSVSFDRFCLTAGIEALGTMMEQDAEQACGARHARSDGRRGHRWGRTQGKIGFHAGKVAVERPRVRDVEGHELALPSWERAVAEDWLGKWAMNLMLINVSTRKFRRAVRLPEGDVPAPALPALGLRTMGPSNSNSHGTTRRPGISKRMSSRMSFPGEARYRCRLVDSCLRRSQRV